MFRFFVISLDEKTSLLQNSKKQLEKEFQMPKDKVSGS